MTADNPAAPAQPRLHSPQLLRAAGVVMVSFALTGLLGIIRQAIIGSRFGAGADLDAYIAANRVSETLFTLVSGGALGSAFIPVFARIRQRDPSDSTDAWRLASATATLIGVIGTLLAIAAAILAGPIVSTLLLPQADPVQKALTVRLMREMLATVTIFGLSGLSMAILNANQHFLSAALAPSLYNVGLIGGALIFAPVLASVNHGIDGLAFGTLLGALLHLGIQLPVLLRLPGARSGLRIRWEPYAPGVLEVFRLMIPRVLGLGVIQINYWVNTALTSDMAAGSLTALAFAFALLFTVLGLLGQSVGTAVFPTLAALNANADVAGFQRVLMRALRGVLFLAIPATVGLWLLAEPLVATIYGHGVWTASNTIATAWALRLYVIGLVGFALQEILARAFYALKDTTTPVVVGTIGVILNVILSLILKQVVHGSDPAQGGFGGLALANALATLIESAAMWILIERAVSRSQSNSQRKIHSHKTVHRSARQRINTEKQGGSSIWTAIIRIILATAIMGVVVSVVMTVMIGWASFIQLVIGAGVGISVFGGCAIALGLDEARQIPKIIIARLRR